MCLMRSKLKLGGALAVMICLAVILTVGCGDDKNTTGPGDEEIPPSRKDGNELLGFYACAIVNEDIDAYDEALHDSFIWVFPFWVADSLGLPPGEPWWGKTAELAAMHRLFEDSTVVKIEFEFADRDLWSPVELEIEPGSFVNGMFTRTTPVTRLTIQEPGQEPKMLVFDASYLDITIVRDPKFPDHVLWVIARIEEVLKNPVAPNLREIPRLSP